MNHNIHNYLLVMGADSTPVAGFGILPKSVDTGLTRRIIGTIVFKYPT